MEPNDNYNVYQYGFLIKADKSATKQLDDICQGLAKVIVSTGQVPQLSRLTEVQCDLEPGTGNDQELTPIRLAACYKKCGVNYDSLFLDASSHGLSYMYRTLGCYQSLQPTANPFQDPSIPCLTAVGFTRWQTLQLLLCPEDSKRFLQTAIETWDIPRPDGGYFPRPVPAECFPALPDQAMEKWYTHVIGSLNQDKYMRRLKASPYQSPHPEGRKDGYFANGAPRPTRQNSYEDEQARLAAYRRRSSVPDIVSPGIASADRSSHWEVDKKRDRKARSHSAQRPPHHVRQRSHTASTPDRSSKHGHSPPSRRTGTNLVDESSNRPNSRPVSSHHNPQHQSRHSGGQGQPSVNDNTGSEASSEESRNGSRPHARRPEEPDRDRRRSSLWPPSFLKSNKRRHSTEAPQRRLEAKPALPARSEYYPPPPLQKQAQHPPPVLQPNSRPVSGVRFRDDMFANNSPRASVPGTPILHPPTPQSLPFDPRLQNQPPPTIRYPEPPPPSAYPTHQMDNINLAPLTRESSGSSGTDRRHHSGADWDKHMQRKSGAPTRVATVSGVSGRKYPHVDPPIADKARHQARVRGSLPAAV